MSTMVERGIPGVRERISRSQNRLIKMINEKRLRDLDEIWEAYYDVEEAILLSKIIFGEFAHPGKVRKLNVPPNFDFSKLADSEIRARFESAGKDLTSAETNLSLKSAEETIEFLRRARDVLKIMLLKPRKSLVTRRKVRRKR